MRLQRFVTVCVFLLGVALYPEHELTFTELVTHSGHCETPKYPVTTKQPLASEGSLSPALERLNQQMHHALRSATAHLRKDLGPLLIFEEGKMKLLKQNKEVAAFDIMPPLEYQQLKVFGHVFFATVIMLQRPDLGDAERLTWLTEMKKDIDLAIVELKQMKLSAELKSSQEKLLSNTRSLLTELKTAKPSLTRLEQYIKDCLPDVWRGARQSASLHLKVIDTQAKRIIGLLSQEERQQLKAHLYGGRGARRDNLVIQYLSWLFGEGSGQESDRIIFSENIRDHNRALDMFAKYRMESDLAKLIFQDSKRLDRDLLGDVTRELIKSLPNVDEVMNAIPSP